MSESRAIYDVGNSKLTKRSDFVKLPSAKPYGHPDYRPPTQEEVAALLRFAGWLPRHATQALGMKWSTKKGNGTLRRWKSGGDSYLQIPYTPWRLMLIYAGIVQAEFPDFYEA